MKCPECRTLMTEAKPRAYKYKECGLPNVTLVGVTTFHCPSCGEDAVAIPRVAELHETIAWAVAQKDARLSGEEIRFLRKYLGLSGIQMSSVMGVSRETVSRWETGAAPMGIPSERLLRLMVFRLKPVEAYPSANLATLGTEKPKGPHSLQVAKTDRGWSVSPGREQLSTEHVSRGR